MYVLSQYCICVRLNIRAEYILNIFRSILKIIIAFGIPSLPNEGPEHEWIAIWLKKQIAICY